MTIADRARAYLAKVPGAPEGERDNTTAATACRLVELFDLPEHDLLDLLLEWNGRANTPPLSEREVRKCLASACSRTAYKGDAAAEPRPAPTPQRTPAMPLPAAEELAKWQHGLATGTHQRCVEARAYLEQYGIDPAACGWGIARVTPEKAQEARLPDAAAGVRLLVPIYLPDGPLGDVRRYRGPFGDGDADTKVLPWAQGHGSAKPYGWHNLPADADLVVWCEGEKDREALAAHGFAAVSHTCGASSAAKVAGDLPAELLAGPRFVVLFDHDEAGRHAAASTSSQRCSWTSIRKARLRRRKSSAPCAASSPTKMTNRRCASRMIPSMACRARYIRRTKRAHLALRAAFAPARSPSTVGSGFTSIRPLAATGKAAWAARTVSRGSPSTCRRK